MLRKLYDIIIKLMQNVKIIYFSIKGLSQTMFEITPNKIINNYVSDISIVNGCIFRYAKNLHRQAWLLTYLLCAFNFLIFIEFIAFIKLDIFFKIQIFFYNFLFLFTFFF